MVMFGHTPTSTCRKPNKREVYESNTPPPILDSQHLEVSAETTADRFRAHPCNVGVLPAGLRACVTVQNICNRSFFTIGPISEEDIPMALSHEELARLTRESVDPGSFGTDDLTPTRSYNENSGRSDENLVATIERRNRERKPTYKLRLDYAHRLKERT